MTSSLMTMTQSADVRRSAGNTWLGERAAAVEVRFAQADVARGGADSLPAAGIQRDPLRQPRFAVGGLPFAGRQHRGIGIVRRLLTPCDKGLRLRLAVRGIERVRRRITVVMQLKMASTLVCRLS